MALVRLALYQPASPPSTAVDESLTLTSDQFVGAGVSWYSKITKVTDQGAPTGNNERLAAVCDAGGDLPVYMCLSHQGPDTISGYFFIVGNDLLFLDTDWSPALPDFYSIPNGQEIKFNEQFNPTGAVTLEVAINGAGATTHTYTSGSALPSPAGLTVHINGVSGSNPNTSPHYVDMWTQGLNNMAAAEADLAGGGPSFVDEDTGWWSSNVLAPIARLAAASLLAASTLAAQFPLARVQPDELPSIARIEDSSWTVPVRPTQVQPVGNYLAALPSKFPFMDDGNAASLYIIAEEFSPPSTLGLHTPKDVGMPNPVSLRVWTKDQQEQGGLYIVPEEFYWKNNVAPVVAVNTIPLPWGWASEQDEQARGLYGVPEENTWSVPLVSATPPVPLAFTADDGLPVAATVVVDEDVWTVPVPASAAPLVLAFTADDDAPSHVYEEDAAPVIVPLWIGAALPLTPWVDEDVPSLSGTAEDVPWTNAVPPVSVANTVPSTWSFEQHEVATGLYGTLDEDGWQPRVIAGPPIVVVACSDTDDLPTHAFEDDASPLALPWCASSRVTPWSDEEIPAGFLRAVPEDTPWQNAVAPVQAINAVPAPWGFEQNESALTSGQPDEDLWENPVAPVPASNVWPNPWSFEQHELATGLYGVPSEDGWQPPLVASARAANTPFTDDDVLPSHALDEGTWSPPLPVACAIARTPITADDDFTAQRVVDDDAGWFWIPRASISSPPAFTADDELAGHAYEDDADATVRSLPLAGAWIIPPAGGWDESVPQYGSLVDDESNVALVLPPWPWMVYRAPWGGEQGDERPLLPGALGGTVRTYPRLVGTITTVSEISGTVTTEVQLSGSITTLPMLAGQVQVRPELTGLIRTVPRVTATIRTYPLGDVAMSTENTMREASTNVIEVTKLKDQITKDWIDGATIVATLYDGDGMAVVGATDLPVTLEAGTSGSGARYLATVAHTVSLASGTYTLYVTATSPDTIVRRFVESVTVEL